MNAYYIDQSRANIEIVEGKVVGKYLPYYDSDRWEDVYTYQIENKWNVIETKEIFLTKEKAEEALALLLAKKCKEEQEAKIAKLKEAIKLVGEIPTDNIDIEDVKNHTTILMDMVNRGDKCTNTQ